VKRDAASLASPNPWPPDKGSLMMNSAKITHVTEIFIELDLKLCRLFNLAGRRKIIQHFFSHISRLGNGVFWYGLIIALPFVYGINAIHTSGRMILVAVAGLITYKLIKSSTERLRPFMVDARIEQGTAPLDKYSFPSGHTLHATSLSIVLLYDLPALYWLVVPFAVLVALSRMILGLHYPTDVIAGALLGSALATAVLSI